MKILFVTMSDIGVCTSSNIRNISLISGLLEEGHTVDIISYKTSNSANLKDDSFMEKIKDCKIQYISGSVATEKISANLHSKNSPIAKFKKKFYTFIRNLYYKFETVDSLKNIATTVNIDNLEVDIYDCMISSSNPFSVHILAKRIKNKYFPNGIKWVQYWGDSIYTDTLTRHHFFPWILKKTEYKLIEGADAVVYTNDVCLKLQKKIFPQKAEQMHFIETPFAFSKDNNDAKIKYSVGYYGGYSSSVRDILPLYSVLSKADYESIIVGNGDVEIFSKGNLKVLPRASVNEVNEYENETNVLVCLCNKLSAKGKDSGTIPGKAYHYGATKKPILVIDATPMVKEFLMTYDRYYFADNNEREIKEALDSVLAKEIVEIEPMEEVLPKNAAKKLLKIIDEINL